MERIAPLSLRSLAGLLCLPGAWTQDDALHDGTWRAWLLSPGGELPFGLELALADGRREAVVVNGPERIAVPRVDWDGTRLELGFDHYAARIVARLQADGTLAGEWTKRRAGGEGARLELYAERAAGPRFRALEAPGARADVGGRWAVDFESDELPAVGELLQESDGTLTGTFLTATGDWRYLAGDVTGHRLRLSAFDGAHAFLLDARLDEEGELQGDFWSGDAWHETWHARRDERARAPDAFEQSRWDERTALVELVFPDLDGELRSLAELAFGARAIVLQLFGSWCPNCHDEGAYLAELDRRYRARGLAIIGLAFELDPDPAANAEQVHRYARRHACEYPFLLAGSAASKEAASRAIPALDRLRSYPTTVFLHADGRARAVHSGFAGPATGAAHEELARAFEALVEELLAEPEPSTDALWSALEGVDWRSDSDWSTGHGSGYRFRRAQGRAIAQTNRGQEPVEMWGDHVRIGGELWRWDGPAGVLVHPSYLDMRLVRRDHGAQLLASRGFEGADGRRRALAEGDALVRCEAIFGAVARLDSEAALLVRALFTDPEPDVRATALWFSPVLIAPRPVERIAAALADPDARVRRAAAYALAGAAQDPLAAAALERALDDPDALVRDWARQALGEVR